MASVTFNFAGKRALVTGAGRGIGRALAIALSKAGAETFALSRTKETLDSLVKEYPAIHPVCVDLSKWDETRKAVEQLGQIDFLVNNAGIALRQPFLEVDQESIEKTFKLMFDAVVNVSQIVAKTMIKNKKPGAIVNISSQVSKRATVAQAVYGASKGALDNLTKTMVLELGPHQIRINSVHPTVVLTDMGKYWNDEKVGGPMKARIPLGRFAEESEMVGPVLFLLSDAASMVNGAFLTVDGGFTVA